jgi:protein-L-isoaspartate(D-aspartate) O-methyltransferase
LRYTILNKLFASGICLLGLASVPSSYAATDYTEAREQLIRNIEQSVRETSSFIGISKFDDRVMQAMSKVPRHEFVPHRHRDQAYYNQPLPIGHGQTISQPYIVALMTDLLSVKPTDKALEIGTGSGYQAAILAELADQVFTIEIVDALAKRASEVLEQQGYKNITARTADGYFGWQEHAPFDVIVVTAAASYIPPPLIQQLKAGGRMVIPVGSRFMVQQLVLVEKDDKGKVSTRQILPVRFVPLTGGHD